MNAKLTASLLIVAAVLAGGAFGLLTGCSRAPADESADSPVPAPSTVPPAAPTARPIRSTALRTRHSAWS